ncbi:hypothetical protein WR25_00003 [Diploscapter pachys]|uniref:Chitin synthase chs-1/2 N-terminal putative transporter domain-containing protein n=1 Tax=Diploscapter pachys TaxID=2018661 RepID=A0A2A2LBZ8_9BILA|nr:hypothetical protein WR25_00003 [Diploscapter pachys]
MFINNDFTMINQSIFPNSISLTSLFVDVLCLDVLCELSAVYSQFLYQSRVPLRLLLLFSLLQDLLLQHFLLFVQNAFQQGCLSLHRLHFLLNFKQCLSKRSQALIGNARGIVVFRHLQKSVDFDKNIHAFLQTHEEHSVLQHLQPIPFHFLLLEQQLGLFLLINAFLVLGAVFSRLAILILSTNITGNDESTDNFNRKCSRLETHRTPKLVAALYVGLFLIQCLPDLLHIFCNASTFFRRQGGRVIPSLVVLESVRSFGLCLLVFLVFPQLDVHRCILLLACFPMVVLIQNCFASLAATLNPALPFCARFGRSIMLSPYILLMLVVLSSTYLWAVLDTPLEHWVLMPIALFSVSVGFWESWIGVQNAGTAFDNLYRLKYAVRKVSSSTRWLVALCRVVICLSILVVAVIEHKHKGLKLTHFFTVLVDFNLKKHYSGINFLNRNEIATK